MKGAIIGDIVGSVYEWHNIKTKDFPLFREDCFFTDDTVMTCAVAEALLNSTCKPSTQRFVELTKALQRWGRKYPGRGYGGHFGKWIFFDKPEPYNSWGNGAPMRCSAAGWLAVSEDDAINLGAQTALPTHNHEEGIKAASCTAQLIWRARHGASMDELEEIAMTYYPRGFHTLEELRPKYSFHVASQRTMPAVFPAFFESTDFVDAIRNAISVGGDSDTIAAIVGSIAEAYYGVPDTIWESAVPYLDKRICDLVEEFYTRVEERDD